MGTVETTGKLCTECKSNPQLKRKGTRKFEICYECRVAQVKELIAGRKVRRTLDSSLGRLVQYYDQGWRCGYLVKHTQFVAVVQPIGPGPLEKELKLQLGNIRPSIAQSETYPTLQSYLASKPAPVALVRVVQVDMAAVELRTAGLAMRAAKNGQPFDITKAVELFKQGMKVVDIAVALGYPRGQGNNRTRKALREAGVYN